MKQADRSGADIALILDTDGSAIVRDMETGEQRSVQMNAIVSELAGR
jgi:histidyl-tRNA synthetase